MDYKYLYIKFIGLLLVIFGFGYSLTAFYNIFDVLVGNKIILANTSLLVTSMGSLFPLFIFVFGMFFYFYGDVYKEKSNKLIFICSIIVLLIGIFKLLLLNDFIYGHIGIINSCLDFVHPSFGYVSLLLGLLLIGGRIKFKY